MDVRRSGDLRQIVGWGSDSSVLGKVCDGIVVVTTEGVVSDALAVVRELTDGGPSWCVTHEERLHGLKKVMKVMSKYFYLATYEKTSLTYNVLTFLGLIDLFSSYYFMKVSYHHI